MKSSNPDILLTYLVFNELVAWAATIVFTLYIAVPALAFADLLVFWMATLFGSLLIVTFYLCNQDLFFESKPRALAAAFISPVIQGTKINRPALIFYLINRACFTDLPAGIMGLWLADENALANVLYIWAFTCFGVLLFEAIMLIVWEVRNARARQDDEKFELQ